MDALANYLAYNRAVMEGHLEAERLDELDYQQRVREDRIARGYCPFHPQVKVSNGMFDAPCYACEAEMENA